MVVAAIISLVIVVAATVGEDSNDDDNKLLGYAYIQDIRVINTDHNSVVSLSTGLRFI
jgi:hypothetical protein